MKKIDNIIRVGELKCGDLFVMDNTEYEVVEIKDGLIYYKTMLCSSVNKNNTMSQKSQKFVQKK